MGWDWMGLDGIGWDWMDGSPCGQGYRAPYGANNTLCVKVAQQFTQYV